VNALRSFSADSLQDLAPSDIVDALRSDSESGLFWDTGDKGSGAVPFCIARHPVLAMGFAYHGYSEIGQ